MKIFNASSIKICRQRPKLLSGAIAAFSVPATPAGIGLLQHRVVASTRGYPAAPPRSHTPSQVRTLTTAEPMSSQAAQENVWDYPRPPACVKCNKHITIEWLNSGTNQSTLILETDESYRVLETSHPPTFYLPPSSIVQSGQVQLVKQQGKQSYCEWKGMASYWTLRVTKGSDVIAEIPGRIWSYESPTSRFKELKDHFSFYPSAFSRSGSNRSNWVCKVDGEVVKAQEGDFYGGWVTKEITGGQKGFKGGPGTWGW